MTIPQCACGTELTKVRGRRRGATYWWCWKCEKAVRVSRAPLTAFDEATQTEENEK